MMTSSLQDRFLTKGYAHVEQLLEEEEVRTLRHIYQKLLADKERTKGLRSDLAGEHTDTKQIERITQVMRPSWVEEALATMPIYTTALRCAQDLLGEDMAFDFDMLINKAPHTNTPTPWHQDAAYWIDLPDRRAVSIWVALDDVDENNGCMWFIPRKSTFEVLPHQSLNGKGALYCEPIGREQAEAIPLSKGGCTFHDGYTLHFSRGNTTDRQRRALILNFRPKAMIELERSQGYDHTGGRTFRNKK
jgi:ectoine hydroxylase-related dioxygenase (phytanoyl-CoA dioxygenase family)